jgi:hypothetical protein
MDTGGGISLQIAEVEVKIVLDRFLVEAKMKAVGNLDNTLNDERYNYISLLNGMVAPWYQDTPLKPIRYAEGVAKTEDMLLVYPVASADQAAIQLLPRSERAILYAGAFAIHGNVSMGGDMTLLTVMDGLIKRFLTLTNVSIFPLFPANAVLPEMMPVALLNKAMVYQLHAAEG